MEITSKPADEYFVFILSDADIKRYEVTPEALGRVLTMNPRVHAYALFIAPNYDEAEQLRAASGLK